MVSYTRRTVLAALTGVGLAGCTSITGSDPPSENELPDQCPTSLDLDVEWPRDLDTNSVEEFVIAYEEGYLTEEYTDSQFTSVDVSTRLDQDLPRFLRGFPPNLSGEFHMTVHSGGGIVSQEMILEALKVDLDGIPVDENRINVIESPLPDEPEYVPIDEVEYQQLRQILQTAADSGIGEGQTSAESEMKRYVELIADLPPSATLDDAFNTGAYFDVNGTPVLLVIETRADSVADFRTTAQYYVTEHVVRRTDEQNRSPRDGPVVECRLPNRG